MMKIHKFGTININSNGELNISGFRFLAETKEEERLNPNDPETVFAVIGNYFLNMAGEYEVKPDFNAERIVANAIKKASGVKNGN